MKTASICAGLAILVLSACASKSTGTGSDTSGTQPPPAGPQVVVTPPADPPAAPPAPPPAAPPTAAGECSAETSQQDCVTCCSKAHTDGATTYIGAVMACMCTADNCQSQCEKTLCNDTNPTNADGECNTCITAHQSACASDIKSACTADAQCVAFDKCVGDSDCLGKTK